MRTQLLIDILLKPFQLAWNEAKLDCESQGMRLACPEDDDQKTNLQRFIMTNGLTPVDKFCKFFFYQYPHLSDVQLNQLFLY